MASLLEEICRENHLLNTCSEIGADPELDEFMVLIFFLCFNLAFQTYYNVCLIWLPRNNSKKRKLGIWLLFPFFLLKFSVLLVAKVHVTYCSLLLLKESYCEALHRYKEELSKPFDEATTFLSSIELQLSNLCKGTLTRNFDYRSGTIFLNYIFETFLNSESYNFLYGFAPSSYCQKLINGSYCFVLVC